MWAYAVHFLAVDVCSDRYAAAAAAAAAQQQQSEEERKPLWAGREMHSVVGSSCMFVSLLGMNAGATVSQSSQYGAAATGGSSC